jgi:hypothetical protein
LQKAKKKRKQKGETVATYGRLDLERRERHRGLPVRETSEWSICGTAAEGWEMEMEKMMDGRWTGEKGELETVEHHQGITVRPSLNEREERKGCSSSSKTFGQVGVRKREREETPWHKRGRDQRRRRRRRGRGGVVHGLSRD